MQNERPEYYLHSKNFERFYLPIIKVFAWTLLKVLGPVQNKGSYRVPRSGGLLILANHLADVDPIIVQCACPRPVYFMAKSELFDIPVLAKVMKFFGTFAVKRGEPDRAAIKQALYYLKNGNALVVYPEGQLSEDGRLQELKPGVGLMVRLSGATVICCGIQGSNKIMPYGITIPRPAFRKIPVVWGEPRHFESESSIEEVMEWASSELKMLVGEEYS